MQTAEALGAGLGWATVCERWWGQRMPDWSSPQSRTGGSQAKVVTNSFNTRKVMLSQCQGGHH